MVTLIRLAKQIGQPSGELETDRQSSSDCSEDAGEEYIFLARFETEHRCSEHRKQWDQHGELVHKKTNIIALPYRKSLTITTLRQLLADECGLDVANDTFIFNGENLGGSRTMVECEFGAGDTIHWRTYRGSERNSKLIIRMLSERRIILPFLETENIGQIKRRIEDAEGIPVCQIRMHYNGQLFEEDGRYLYEYGVLPSEIILMVLRQRGAKPVIYLYPPSYTRCVVDVDLAPFWKFYAVYPPQVYPPIDPPADHKSHMQWLVDATPEGVLSDPHNAKQQYPYLFWEADTVGPSNSEFFNLHDNTTMVMAPTELTSYLNEVLTTLHLDYKQRADFLTFWAPVYKDMPFVAFRFATPTELTNAARLTICPQPTHVIRVYFLFALAEQPKDEPKTTDWEKIVLDGVDVAGWKKAGSFSVMEWGGTIVR